MRSERYDYKGENEIFVESEVSDTTIDSENALTPDDILDQEDYVGSYYSTDDDYENLFDGAFTDIETRGYGEGFWKGAGLVTGGGVVGVNPEVRNYVAEIVENIEPSLGPFIRASPFITFAGSFTGMYAGLGCKKGLDRASEYLEEADLKYSEKVQNVVDFMRAP